MPSSSRSGYVFDMERFYSRLGETFKPGIINEVVLAAFELMKQGKKIISLTGGSYDPASLPVKQIREIFSEAPQGAWQEMLQYGSSAGTGRLRSELCKFMRLSGIEADPDGEIVVTTGSQQALDIVSKMFIDGGDVVMVGSPTYLEALTIFKQFSPELRSVPVDVDGMNTDSLRVELRRLASEGKHPKLVYVVPSYDNPTGVVMSRERRLALLELAEEFDFLVLEDNPYGYISFEGAMPTPIKALDKTGRVLYMSTFSKIVSPGLRIGWLAARKEFVSRMVEAKSNIDLCSDGLSQYVAAELLRRGAVDRQIPYITKVYRGKRDLMLEAMRANFPKEAGWSEPRGGLFIWVRLPEKINADEILMEAIQKGVAYIPGSNFFPDPPVRNYIRLNYSYPSNDDIVEGITILGRLLKDHLHDIK